MEIILKFFAGILLFIGHVITDCLHGIVDAFRNDSAYQASFGREQDIASRYNKGFVVSTRQLTLKKSTENLAIIGNTGGGKTSKLILPSILELAGNSMIINDGGDLFDNTSGYLSIKQKVKLIDLSNADISSGYNFIDALSLDQQSEIEKLSHILVKPRKDNKSADDYWETKSRETCSLLIRLALHQRPELRNISFMVDALKDLIADPPAFDNLIVKTGDAKLFQDYKVLISNSDKTLASILSSTKGSLLTFEDPHLARIASKTDIQFSDLRNPSNATAIYLRTNPAQQEYHAKFIEIFFTQFYSYILGAGLPSKKDKRFIFCIIDEAASLYISQISTALAVCRKYNVGTLLGLQNHQQLEKLYSVDSKNIMQNLVTKVYLTGQSSTQTLSDLESLMGKTRRKDKEGHERIEPLLSSDAIRCLPQNKCLIISGSAKPIIGRVRPYYKTLKYKKLTSMPPATLKGTSTII